MFKHDQVFQLIENKNCIRIGHERKSLVGYRIQCGRKSVVGKLKFELISILIYPYTSNKLKLYLNDK